jgi:hypothetical protein
MYWINGATILHPGCKLSLVLTMQNADSISSYRNHWQDLAQRAASLHNDISIITQKQGHQYSP